MFILAADGTALPPATTGGVVLVLGLLLLAAWTRYFYR